MPRTASAKSPPVESFFTIQRPAAAEIAPDLPYEFILNEAFQEAERTCIVPSSSPPIEYVDAIPIPETSPFYGLNWILFRPGYEGRRNPCPPDGVRFKEFECLEKIYHDIATGRTCFTIFEDPKNKQFKIDVLHALKTALTRATSRKLILELLQFPDATLRISTRKQYKFSCTAFGKTRRDIHIHLFPDALQCITRAHRLDPPGPSDHPLLIVLLHELVHARHMLQFSDQEWTAITSKRPCHRVDADNFEEEQVIFEENLFRVEFDCDFRLGHGGIAIPHQSPKEFTLLNCCYAGDMKGVLRFLDEGVDPNLLQHVGNEFSSPLVIAAERGQFEIVDLLLSRGANPLLVPCVGKTFLHALIKAGNLQRFQYYINYLQLSIPHFDQNGGPLLHKALEELKGDAGPYIQYLMLNGANSFALDHQGRNVLHYAAMIKDLSFFDYFAAIGNDHNLLDVRFKKPLHYALHTGNLELVQRLFDPLRDLHSLTISGNTVLCYALLSLSQETLEYVLEMERQYLATIPPSVRPKSLMLWLNHSGESPLFQMLCCAKYGGVLSSEWIAQYFAKGGCLSALTSRTKREETQTLIGIFANVAPQLSGRILTMIYAQNPNWINQPLCHKTTLLNWAIYEGDLDLLQIAVQLGADLTLQNGSIPLFYAVDRNQYEAGVALIAHGADVNQKNGNHTLQQFIQARATLPNACFNPNFFNLVNP